MTDTAMKPTRRSFLGGVLSVLAVAAVGAEAATAPMIYGDGIRDDAPGIQALIDGKPFRVFGGGNAAFIAESGRLSGGMFKLSRGLVFSDGILFTLEKLTILCGPDVEALFTFMNGAQVTLGGVDARFVPKLIHGSQTG